MAERHSCPHCGDENEAGQRFCGSCGGALELACSVCGASNPLGFRFCGNCGGALRASAAGQHSGEERRVVTVLFADLVGFTSRAEQLDPEDVRAILTPYYTRVRDEIEAFGGTVEKFIGDAVMAVFGAPVAYGDDPERAVRAALRIRDGIGDLNAAEGLDLEVRIAVNTGEAIVALGAQARDGEGMVAGDVVNTAARLQTAAPVNAILVGEETYRATRGTIEYVSVEPVAAKGKHAPVAAWRALAAARAPGDREEKGVPMVGRQTELGTLTAIWDRVVDGRPHLVTVFGPPGVGKSRLTTEFAARVEGDGVRVVRGRSLPYGESGAYGAFSQQVKQIAGIFDSDPGDVASERLRQTMEELVDGESAGEVSSHMELLLGLGVEGDVGDRQVLFYSARRVVEALAAREPTVLVFEDLQWADASLLDLIELLASRIRETPLLIIALARPDLLAERPSWGAGLSAYTALPLTPLDAEQSRELAELLLSRAADDSAGGTASDVAARSEGNPLFIEELAASLAERTLASASSLPTSIRGIVAARLDAVRPVERALLLDASVMGNIFWGGALARLGAYGEELSQLLDSLEGRDLIRREPVSRIRGQQQFRFKHELIRDVAYATLPRAKRRAAHAVVAGFFEEMTTANESPATVGHHWRESGDGERAIAYLEAAAEQASRGWAKGEAVRLYQEALALVPEDDTERRRQLRLKAGVAQQMLYHVADAELLGRAEPERAAD
jgi:class 3 adenylate cyclase